MDFWVKVVLIVIALHLLLGFGWLVYKLSPGKKQDDKQSSEE
jgi:hypothetical protein